MPDTPRLTLNSPLGSDPFLREDFVENWSILDDNPGIFVCTSTNLPSWPGAAAGRKVYETDTKRIRNWNGTVWESLENYGRGAVYTLSPNDGLGKNVKKTYTFDSAYGCPRACRLMLVGSARIVQEAAYAQNVICQPYIDGTNADAAGGNNTLQFADSGAGASNSAAMFAPMLGTRTVTAGNHSIGMHFDVGAMTNNGIVVSSLRMLVFHVE